MNDITLSKQGDETNLVDLLIKEPEEAIEHLNLRYVVRERLTILRIRKAKGFAYVYKNKPLKKKDDLERIHKLVIPPAWEGVRISPWANAHLQAVGADVKKRIQYRYHPVWLKIRNRTKFYKMLPFGAALPKIRTRVAKDLELNGWPKNRVLALIVSLMEETHIRVGNEQYAKRNKTYGLSTLRTRHLKIFKDKIRFEFTGKKGKRHKVTLRNKKLIHLVGKCEEIPGWELFQFFDEDGKKTPIDSGMVNFYIHEISGHMFTAKDFRTWAGTVIFFESLQEMPLTTDEKTVQKNILQAFDKTAKALGNTRNVCRKYYVHPLLVQKYQQGELNEKLEQLNNTDVIVESSLHSPTEDAVLQLIKEYSPLKDLKQ